MRSATKNCGTLLEYYHNINTNGQCGMQYFLTPLNESIWVFTFSTSSQWSSVCGLIG